MNTQVIGNAEIAELIEVGVRKLVAGNDLATTRCDFRLALRERGLSELDSDEDWLNEILTVNARLRQAWRSHDWGINNKVILDQWPAQELCELGGPYVEPCDWQQRWSTAGGKLFDGRMIAQKFSNIWTKMSDFGFPFPPYAKKSHLWTKEVNRNEARNLGLIDRDTQVFVQPIAEPALILFEPDPEQLDEKEV